MVKNVTEVILFCRVVLIKYWQTFSGLAWKEQTLFCFLDSPLFESHTPLSIAVLVTSVHWSLCVTRSPNSRHPSPSTSHPLTLTPSSALPWAWERNSGNIFPCEMPRSSQGVWRHCIVPAAKKGTACDEANSCWSQKNRHFLTPTSFLIGQHKAIPDQPAKRKRKKKSRGRVSLDSQAAQIVCL